MRYNIRNWTRHEKTLYKQKNIKFFITVLKFTKTTIFLSVFAILQSFENICISTKFLDNICTIQYATQCNQMQFQLIGMMYDSGCK